MAFDYNTATTDEIIAEAARRRAKKDGVTPPDPIQEKRNLTRLEKEEQAAVIKRYKRYGCTVYNNSQPRKAKFITPGQADLLVFSPLRAPPRNATRDFYRIMWYHETKRPVGGVYSIDQLTFKAHCAAAGIDCLGGGVEIAQQQLDKLGLRPL